MTPPVIARTVERMGNEIARVSFRNSRRADEMLPTIDAWAAAFRATQEQENVK